MSKNLKSVFESRGDFDDVMIDFKEIQSEKALDRYIRSFMMKPQTKAGFVWQMSGNQVSKYIKNSIESIDGVLYSEISKFDSINDVINKSKNHHIYDNEDSASSDNTTGFLVVNDFSRANQDLIDFVLSLISGNGDWYLADNWRIICTGNIQSGESFWKDSYMKTFINVEWNPKKKVQTPEDEDDEDLNDSVKEAHRNPLREDISREDVESYVELLKRAYNENEICDNCYVRFYDGGLEIRKPDDDIAPSNGKYRWYPVEYFMNVNTGLVDDDIVASIVKKECMNESYSNKETKEFFRDWDSIKERIGFLDDKINGLKAYIGSDKEPNKDFFRKSYESIYLIKRYLKYLEDDIKSAIKKK